MNLTERKELAKTHGSAALVLCERLAAIYDKFEAMQPRPILDDISTELMGTAGYARDFLRRIGGHTEESTP